LALGYTGEASLSIRRGEELIVDVWWQPVQTPSFNYSASFQIWGANGLLTQTDGNFNGVDAQVLPPGAWSADTRRLTIPPDAPAGNYSLKVTVYNWQDNSRLSFENAPEDRLFTLLSITISD
jgi:hypothetical protein